MKRTFTRLCFMLLALAVPGVHQPSPGPPRELSEPRNGAPELQPTEARSLDPNSGATAQRHVLVPPAVPHPARYPFGGATIPEGFVISLAKENADDLVCSLRKEDQKQYSAKVMLGTAATGCCQAMRIEELWTRGAGPRLVSRHIMVGDHLLLSLVPGKSESELLSALPKGFAVRKRLHRANVFLVSFPVRDETSLPDAQRALRSLPELVASCSADGCVEACTTPSDPLFPQQWGWHNTGQTGGAADADIDGPEAWDIRSAAANALIAIIDTGMDYLHPDLTSNVFQNPGETGLDASNRDRRTNGADDDGNGYVDDWHGWDFVHGDNDPMDDHGHGTHVAGIAGAQANNGIGVSGVCWTCRMLPIKALDSAGRGTWSSVIEAVEYAHRMQAVIGNISFGAYGIAPDEVKAAFAAANGTLWCAAAGNGELPHNGPAGDDLDEFHFFPACFDLGNIVSVTASGSDDSLAGFANRGKFMVDLAAPGVNILSTARNAGYELRSGTSMACAFAAGSASLLYSGQPPLRLRHALQLSVDRTSLLQGLVASRGRLNLFKALQLEDWELPWNALASGDRHHLTIRRDGQVLGWGADDDSATDTWELVPTPTEVPGLADALSVHASGDNSYALTSAGEVWRWLKILHSPPAKIPNLSNVIAFYPEGFALRADGSLVKWAGQNPPQVILTAGQVRRFYTDGSSHFVIHPDASVSVWGLNDEGQLGDGTITNRTSPGKLTTLPEIKRIFPMGSQTFFLSTTNKVWGTGSNSLGALGDGTTTDRRTPILINTWGDVSEMASDLGVTSALRIDGSLWGIEYSFSEGGVIPSLLQQEPAAWKLRADFNWARSYVIHRDGGITEWSLVPAEDAGPPVFERRIVGGAADLVEFSEVDRALIRRGSGGVAALRVDGETLAWGQNSNGELGIGVMPSKSRPVEILPLRGARSFSATSEGTFVVDATGRPWYWGRFGTGIGPQRLSENEAVKVRSDWLAYDAWLFLANGETWRVNLDSTPPLEWKFPEPGVRDAIGSGILMQNGDVWVTRDESAATESPIRVTGLPPIVSLARYTETEAPMALDASGRLWWLRRDLVAGLAFGELLPGITGAALVTDSDALFVVKADGTVWRLSIDVFPDNAPHPILDGPPVQVPGLIGVDRFTTSGRSHYFAKTGIVFASGDNDAGQLGQGHFDPTEGWLDVFGLADIASFECGMFHIMAQRSDGSVWAWGGNEFGQLWDGTGATGDAVPTLAYGLSQQVFNAGNGFSDWLTSYFNEDDLRDVDLSGDEADPDEDGLTNLMEYALGTNPREKDLAAVVLPTASIENVTENYYSNGVGIAELSAGARHLVIRVGRRETRSDIEYIVEFSSDLQDWRSGPGYSAEILDTSRLLIVSDALPADEYAVRYARLRVTRRLPGDSSLQIP